MVPSLKGAGGATPAGALGVTVGAGTASVESAAGALPAEPADAFVCAGAPFAAGAVVGGVGCPAVVWGAEVGVALVCAQTGAGARNRLAAKASVAVLKSLAVKSRICHPFANHRQREDAPHPALSLT